MRVVTSFLFVTLYLRFLYNPGIVEEKIIELRFDFSFLYDLGNNQDKGTVVVINTATNEIEKVIEVGRFPTGLSAILP